MNNSFPIDVSQNHATELAVAGSLLAKLNLLLTSRLASVRSLVGVVVMITPEGVR